MNQQSLRLYKNNFDLLRLLLAGTVCVVHAQDLSEVKLSWISNFLSSLVAVNAFFVVSGFLISMSFERSSSLASYAKKRVRRICPAYAFVVILCAMSLVLVSSNNFTDYFSLEWGKYLLANLTFLNFLQPTLPGVFESNKISAVNGALWTLRNEVAFYVAVPVLAYLFRHLGRFKVIAIAYVTSVAFAALLANMSFNAGSGIFSLLHMIPLHFSYFIAGAFLYYYLPLFESNVWYFTISAFIILAIGKFHPLPLLEPIAVGITVVFFGLFFYAGNFGKYGDFSYGLYILHFPIIQLLVHYGWLKGNPILFIFAVLIFTSIGAIALWHIVEKQFLFRSSHYISAATTTENKTQ